MLRKIFVTVLAALAVGANIAATGTSQANAIAMITIAGLGLPFLFKLVPSAGHWMVAITVVVSLLASIGAEVLSGELVLSALPKADVPTLLASFLSVYGLTQFLYALLTQSPKTTSAVSEAPAQAGRASLKSALALAVVALLGFSIFVACGEARPGPQPTPSAASASPSTEPSPSPVVVPPVAPPPAAPKATYAVRAGDSLWSVAKARYGARVNACYTVLYRENAATIEAAARAHGHRTSQHGRWLFAGTVLKLPSGC